MLIPSISRWQWHPITVAGSAPDPDGNVASGWSQPHGSTWPFCAALAAAASCCCDQHAGGAGNSIPHRLSAWLFACGCSTCRQGICAHPSHQAVRQVDQGAQRRCGVCCPYVLPPLMHGPCCRSCLPCVDSPCRGVAQHRALQASPAAQPLAHCGTCPVQMQRCRCMCGCCCLCTALQELMERLQRPQPLAVRVSGDHQQQLQQHAAAGSS